MTAYSPIAPSLTLVRRIKAAPARVYAAWTEPESMALWFGPSHTNVVMAEADVRIGGRFRVVMREESGETHDVSGIYTEVEPERRLAFSWAWITTPERESKVTVVLRPIPEGTELTLIHERFFDEAARDAHEGGWSEALDRLRESFA